MCEGEENNYGGGHYGFVDCTDEKLVRDVKAEMPDAGE